MTETRLLKRILWVMAGAVAFLLFALAVRSDAAGLGKISVPPELAQVQLRSAHDNVSQLESQADRNPTLERLGPNGEAREAQESLRAAAIPDFRALAGILLVILLLRRIRRSRRARLPVDASSKSDSRELPRAA